MGLCVRGLPAFEGGLFELPVGGEPIRELAEVHAVAVELGAVDAGVLALAVDCNAAATAHPRSVDEDRVQRYGGLDGVGPGQLGACPHHRHGADCEDLVDAAGLAQVLQGFGHETVAAVAAVVGANDHFATSAQLVLADDPLLGAATNDARDRHAACRQGLRDGVYNRGPNAAADADGVPALEQLGRVAQGPGDVRDRVADLKRCQLVRTLPYRLDDERDRARGAIHVGDGERDSLGPRAAPHDDELPGPADLGNSGSLDDEARDVGRQLRLADDRVHLAPAEVAFRKCVVAQYELFGYSCGPGSPPHDQSAPTRRAEGHLLFPGRVASSRW